MCNQAGEESQNVPHTFSLVLMPKWIGLAKHFRGICK